MHAARRASSYSDLLICMAPLPRNAREGRLFSPHHSGLATWPHLNGPILSAGNEMHKSLPELRPADGRARCLPYLHLLRLVLNRHQSPASNMFDMLQVWQARQGAVAVAMASAAN